MRSYRDTIRLLMEFIAKDNKTKLTKLTVDDFTFERIVGFLRFCSTTSPPGSRRCSPCASGWPPSR
jgi:hypothetical protein